MLEGCDEGSLFLLQRVLNTIHETQGSRWAAPLNDSYLALVQFESIIKSSPISMDDLLLFELDLLLSDYIGLPPFHSHWQIVLLNKINNSFSREFLVEEYGDKEMYDFLRTAKSSRIPIC